LDWARTRPRPTGARNLTPESKAVQSSFASMLEKRNLRLDLCAVILLALVVFLSVSLLTYDPADYLGDGMSRLRGIYQQDVVVYPHPTQTANACGWCGAFVADVLFNSFGLAAYYVVISLGIVDAILLRRQSIDTPYLRSVGWVLSVLGLTSFLAVVFPNTTPGPISGAGGYLGVIGRGMLEAHFAYAGAVILAVSTTLGGLLLSTDYALLRVSVRSAALASQAMRRGRNAFAVPKNQSRTKPADHARNSDELHPVRIRGKQQSDLDPIAASDTKNAKPSEPQPVETPDLTTNDEVSDDAPATAEPSGEEQTTEPVVKKRTKEKPRGTAAAPHFQIENFDKQEREAVMSSLDAASVEDPGDYELPDIELLIEGGEINFDDQVTEVRRKAKILEKTFADFGFKVKVVEIETGPVIAQYEVELEAGLRLSRITGLADDLAIALRVPSVRIVAPIPGKNTVGIEVPNETRQIVRLREVIDESNGKTKKMKIPLFLGKDVSGNPLVVDLSTLPHLLIAGRTGTGKSVCLNAIITSMLMTRKPDEVRLLLIDPKMVELSCYGRLPHLMHPVVTDMRKAEAILAWAVEKMEERYALLARAGVRHISSYNQLGEQELMDRLQPETDEERASIPQHLPYIVIVADEMADLMMTAGKEVEQHIIRLAQKSRAVGIHLILATQKPTVDVITGLIKSNLPARIAFQVASRTDSRVVLDEMGADKLLGNGDLLFLWPGTSTLVRGQGTYLSDEEINLVVDAVSTGEPNYVHELVNLKPAAAEGEGGSVSLKKRDELYESAVDIIVREGRGSVSLLQRALGIGYGRAARLIDFMAEDGIVGPYNGSQARDILISVEDWERMQGASAEPATEPDSKRSRSNKIVPEAHWEDASGTEDEMPSDEVDFQDEDANEEDEVTYRAEPA
jgi:S-DNA-T family DNA segregation ATPase FtsK/SpoIIIE